MSKVNIYEILNTVLYRLVMNYSTYLFILRRDTNSKFKLNAIVQVLEQEQSASHICICIDSIIKNHTTHWVNPVLCSSTRYFPSNVIRSLLVSIFISAAGSLIHDPLISVTYKSSIKIKSMSYFVLRFVLTLICLVL